MASAFADVRSGARSTSKDVTATLNYLGDIEGSARYDIRDVISGKWENSNIAWKPYDVAIRDVRSLGDSPDIEATGFTFIKHDSAIAEDPALFDQNLSQHHHNADGPSAAYEREFCDYLMQTTGAREVFPQLGGLLTRTSLRAEIKGWARPAYHVHLDFTAEAAQMMLDNSLTAQNRTLAPYKRHVLYQTWRAVSSGPQDNTLAICDGRSVPFDDGVIIDSIIGDPDVPGNRFDSRMSRYNPDHRWYYLSDMEPDDVMLFKGFDSSIPNAMNAIHSAFDNPLGQDSVPRRSIEARFIAIFD